jgi:predicted Zn-dependent protease
MLEVTAELAQNHARKCNIDALETFAQKLMIKSLIINSGEIVRVCEHERSGIAIRAIIDNSLSFVSTNIPGKIEELVELSAETARKSYQKVYRTFPTNSEITPVEDNNSNRLRDLTLENLTERIEEILKTLKKSKPLKQLDGQIQAVTEERLISNTEGLWKREVGTSFHAEIQTKIRVNDFYGIGSAHHSSRKVYEDWKEFFNQSIQSAYAQKDRQKGEFKNSYQILLSPSAFAHLLAFGLIPRSYYIVDSSLYGAKTERTIFNNDIELIDDATYPGGYKTYGFDDEGYPTSKHNLIKNGEWQEKLGMNFVMPDYRKREQPLGNCYRVKPLCFESRSFQYTPNICASNVIFQSKNDASVETLKAIKEGIYIKEIVGARDINHFTGDFVAGIVESYYIRNGEIQHSLRPGFCSGNIYKILQDNEIIIGQKKKEIPLKEAAFSIICPEIITEKITVRH